MATIRWQGGEVYRHMAEATVIGVEQTMAEAVSAARANHPAYPPASEPHGRYANRTGAETGSVRSNGASFDGRKVEGSWGAYMNYSLFLEIGTSTSGPTATERMQGGEGVVEPFNPDRLEGWPGVPPPEGPLMAPRPFLRPAADMEYPLLAGRIAAAFMALEG